VDDRRLDARQQLVPGGVSILLNDPIDFLANRRLMLTDERLGLIIIILQQPLFDLLQQIAQSLGILFDFLDVLGKSI